MAKKSKIPKSAVFIPSPKFKAKWDKIHREDVKKVIAEIEKARGKGKSWKTAAAEEILDLRYQLEDAFRME